MFVWRSGAIPEAQWLKRRRRRLRLSPGRCCYSSCVHARGVAVLLPCADYHRVARYRDEPAKAVRVEISARYSPRVEGFERGLRRPVGHGQPLLQVDGRLHLEGRSFLGLDAERTQPQLLEPRRFRGRQEWVGCHAAQLLDNARRPLDPQRIDDRRVAEAEVTK